MRLKETSIAEAKVVPVPVTDANREMFRDEERRMMAAVGTENCKAITNASIVNSLIIAGYNARKKNGDYR
jgi:hypothetical protein